MHLLLAISRGNFSTISVISLELIIEEKKQRTTKQEPLSLMWQPNFILQNSTKTQEKLEHAKMDWKPLK